MSSSSYFQDKIVVVTGGGSGIGKALCLAFAKAGANVVVTDLKGFHEVQQLLPRSESHMALQVDVTQPESVAAMITAVKQRYHKPIDIYCSNAGIVIPSQFQTDSCVKHSLEEWNRILQVNVTSHVTALRLLLPDWKQQQQQQQHSKGVFCVTASAAGLLTMVGDASYGVSKAAAVSFCEHVAIAHSECVRVHCLCPQAVETNLVPQQQQQQAQIQTAALTDGLLTAEECAKRTLEGMERGDFFIFPHETVPTYALRKAQNHPRWLKGMQRLRMKLLTSSSKL